MPYEKGHKYHAPRAKLMVTKHLAEEVRQRIPALIHVEFHLAVASGKDPRLDVDEDGELRVVFDERGGIGPTLEEKIASMKWLADRGYGQAPQMMHVETMLHTTQTSTRLETGALTPAMKAAIRETIRGALAPGPDTRATTSADHAATSADHAPELDAPREEREPAAIDAEWSPVASELEPPADE